jgi:protein N-terminal amidase
MLTKSTGYNFPSREQIDPYLEPTTSGTTTKWAQETAQIYRCYVTVGYPEKTIISGTDTNENVINYNSAVTVSPTGTVLANYRKRYLYYTDETWAAEGDNKQNESGFYAGEVDGVSVAMGICMDINPYQFLAPWDKYEFANHVITSGAQLVILSMAWLTRLSQQELEELPLRPDNDTFSYWIERFFPLQNAKGGPVFIVIANRCGVEKEACYAGTSTVISFRDGRGYIYDILGKYDEQCMIVDLKQVGPLYCFPLFSRANRCRPRSMKSSHLDLIQREIPGNEEKADGL